MQPRPTPHMVAFVNQAFLRWHIRDRSGDATRALQATMNQTHMVAFVNQAFLRWHIRDRSGDATRALQATMNQTHIRGLVTSISSDSLPGPASLYGRGSSLAECLYRCIEDYPIGARIAS